MINHYTANKKVRNDDAYSPRRPDRPAARPGDAALLPAGPRGVPRRAGHRRRRRGVAAPAGPLRLLERHRPPVDPARLQGRPGRLRHGRAADRRDRPPAGGRRDGAATCATCAASPTRSGREARTAAGRTTHRAARRSRKSRPTSWQFAEATRIIHQDTNPFNAKTLVQFHDRQAVVVNPPALPLSQDGHGPRLRPAVHPPAAPDVHGEPIPAFEMIKDSVTIMRGCFGGCTFCSITAHQGRIIQSRSQESVLNEVRKMAADPEFKGVVTRHRRPDGQHVPDALHAARGRGEVQAALVRPSDDLQAARHRPRPARRADEAEPARSRASARCSSPAASAWTWPSCRPSTCDELAAHHVGGHLKVAPEHTDPNVLRADEEAGRSTTSRASPRRSRRRRKQAGKPKQYLVPYFIASHPGSDLHAMIDLAALPQAQRLPARPGAGLHPGAVRHRHLHVLHRASTRSRARRSTSPRACATASCSGP